MPASAGCPAELAGWRIGRDVAQPYGDHRQHPSSREGLQRIASCLLSNMEKKITL